jgi:hypothetical protein
VGKFDAWRNLLPADSILYPVINGRLDLKIVAQNSRCIREFLLGICPGIVANAEALSTEVLYFATSSFGHAPVKVAGGTQYAPEPGHLKPFHVEVPVLYALSKFAPELIPTFGLAPVR